MKAGQWFIAILLAILIGAGIAGLRWTNGASQSSVTPLKKVTSSASTALVDQTPLETARKMSAMAATDDERALGREVQKLGDHEVDLAFADALRAAALHTPKLTPELRALLDRKAKAQATVTAVQSNLDELNKKLALAPESRKDSLQDRIAVAKGQLELDEDELEDATEDLARAGGDPQAKIKELLDQHEAGGHDQIQGTNSALIAAEANYQSHTLLVVARAWTALRDKKSELAQAQQEALTAAQELSARHEQFEKQVAAEKEDREALRQQATGFAQTDKSGISSEQSKAAAQAALASLKHHTENQKTLSDFDKRVQDEQQLADLYGNWIGLVTIRQNAALHNVIECLLWILLIVFVVYVIGLMIEQIFKGVSDEKKRIDTLRSVVKFAAQAAGALAIIFIVFGMPSETTTILGLAGAGLTVALKDFIVAFFGWFVLMGKNGIRVGDWVEINGVGGEVVEVGLLNTVLLETGNWNDAGHPTGRRVSFVNSFAIEGHFFNFSTSGQWMWDELQVLIPAGQDPYHVIDGIEKLVGHETATNAHAAEDEWRRATSRYRVQAFSATPGISVVPTVNGIEVRVRYITRAYERHEARKRLYEAIVQLMHGKRTVENQQPALS